MATLNRIYKGKDVEMLTVCATITQQAITHQTFLIANRPTWANPFFPNLQARIQLAFSNYLGIDNAQQMRQATLIVLGLQKNALTNLAQFKVQVSEDFKTNKPQLKQILTTLGITQHLKAAQQLDQEALVELLLKFQLNMSTTLQTQITTAGTPASLISTITSYATTIQNANITQETLKGNRKTITQAALTEFNDIYSQTISVAKISAKLFTNNIAIKDKFSFSKTLKTLNHLPGNPIPTTTTTTTPPTNNNNNTPPPTN